VAERELMARAKTPVPGCRSIAVISRKGGVGKTTTMLMLGHTFSGGGRRGCGRVNFTPDFSAIPGARPFQQVINGVGSFRLPRQRKGSSVT
jgi:hypothetical protein